MAETYYHEADGNCCAFGEDYEHADEYEINYEQPAASPPESRAPPSPGIPRDGVSAGRVHSDDMFDE